MPVGVLACSFLHPPPDLPALLSQRARTRTYIGMKPSVAVGPGIIGKIGMAKTVRAAPDDKNKKKKDEKKEEESEELFEQVGSLLTETTPNMASNLVRVSRMLCSVPWLDVIWCELTRTHRIASIRRRWRPMKRSLWTL